MLLLAGPRPSTRPANCVDGSESPPPLYPLPLSHPLCPILIILIILYFKNTTCRSLNHREDSMKRHQRSKKCWKQRLTYAVASVLRWSPTPRIAAWERGSLASNAPYRFARGSGAARDEDGGEDDEDPWVYSDSSDGEDGLDGAAQGYYGMAMSTNTWRAKTKTLVDMESWTMTTARKMV